MVFSSGNAVTRSIWWHSGELAGGPGEQSDIEVGGQERWVRTEAVVPEGWKGKDSSSVTRK